MNTPHGGGFPPPRPDDVPTPYRTPGEATGTGRVAPQTTADRLRPRAPSAVPARKPKPLPPYAPTKKSLQREFVMASLETPWYLGGPNVLRGLVLAYPRPLGLFLLGLGLLFVVLRIAHVGAPPGTTLVVLGAGLALCDRIPIDRPLGRLAGYGVSVVLGIVVDEHLRGAAYFL